MEQYISKAALVAEIEKLKGKVFDGSSYCDGWQHALRMLEIELNTHEVKDVDLNEEVTSYIHSNTCNGYFRADIHDVAKHFFELGLNSQTKDMQEALRMEYEKGRADVLRCIDPDEMVADFCSQTLSKTRSIASIYRQGIIDIIKRINNNEKTSITGTRSIDDGGVY